MKTNNFFTPQGKLEKYEEGSDMYEAYFKQIENSLCCKPDWSEIDSEDYKDLKDSSFDIIQLEGQEYSIEGFDHFNAHFSDFKDRSCIYAIFARPVSTYYSPH